MSNESQPSPQILLLSWSNEQCKVHQYGRVVAAALGAIHQSVNSLDDAEAAFARHRPDVAIWNWHPETLGKIVHPSTPRRFDTPGICLLHEFDSRLIDGDFFDAYVMPDPTNGFRHPRFFTCGRAIAPYVNRHPLPSVPTVGTFGFGVGIKGYQRVLGLVRESYAEAIIRMHIPANWAVDPEGQVARRTVEELRSQAGPGVTIEASHQWLDGDSLMDWLARNTINVFPYDPVPHPGISSSTDWALAARRPLAITNCGLFKHLRDLPICLESYSLKEIADRGTAPVDHLWERWDYGHFRDRWSVIVAAAIDQAGRRSGGSARTALPSVGIAASNTPVPTEKTWRWQPGFVDRLRLPFPGVVGMPTNQSQAWQDLFVLTALRGLNNGIYLEVGANDPESNSNTWLLTHRFGWSGVSIEYDPAHLRKWVRQRPADRLITADAMALDYGQAIPLWFGKDTKRIDYLQLDIEPSFNTLQVLKKIPLDQFRFSVITFETDVYAGDVRAREESRAMLQGHGYELVAPDVGVIFEPISPNPIAFEDWWVDPAVVDRGMIEALRGCSGQPTLPQHLLFGSSNG
jgi:hypothetical protein